MGQTKKIKTDKSVHRPVFLKEVIENLKIEKGEKYIDATLGEGGYATEILKRGGKLLGIEWDEKVFLRTKKKLRKISKDAIIVNENFANLERVAKERGFNDVKGIVFDLGLSYRQLKESKRGLSFNEDNEVLDMRLNKELPLKAVDILNKFSKEELKKIFFSFGEELEGEKIATEIIKERKRKKILYVKDLKRCIDKAKRTQKKDKYAQTFQALRIYINHELDNLKDGLKGGVEVLKTKGRIIVVTFHSIEDRAVKNFFKGKKFKKIEVKIKKRRRFERSANLRVYQKLS